MTRKFFILTSQRRFRNNVNSLIRKIHAGSSIQLYHLPASEISIHISIVFAGAMLLSFLFILQFILQWRYQFPYHLNMQWAGLVFSELLAIVVTLITISSHLIRLSRVNPVRTLRY
ncbi:MAG: hypothetical protein H0S84_02125 [Bacteroidales bacterium]|jgi:hypothetical protein|nr:hypothetical protein [Bacteroidales bacterium]